jgi:hypothetical protein
MLVVDFDKDSARIYRRTEVRRPDGSYTRPDVRLGTLPLTATSLPPDFPLVRQGPLSERELESLQTKFFDKAKVILERRRIDERERALDPTRRIVAVRGLLQELNHLSQERPVGDKDLLELVEALLTMRSVDPLFPMQAVIAAASAAASAAGGGAFGTRADDMPLKGSAVTTRWNEVRDAVTGADESSLMRALQRKKWVKAKEE